MLLILSVLTFPLIPEISVNIPSFLHRFPCPPVVWGPGAAPGVCRAVAPLLRLRAAAAVGVWWSGRGFSPVFKRRCNLRIQHRTDGAGIFCHFLQKLQFESGFQFELRIVGSCPGFCSGTNMCSEHYSEHFILKSYLRVLWPSNWILGMFRFGSENILTERPLQNGAWRFLLVPEGSRCFLKVHIGSWRVLLVPLGSWVFLLVAGGSWRFPKVPEGSCEFLKAPIVSSRFLLVFKGSCCCLKVHTVSWRVLLVPVGSWRVLLDLEGFYWFLKVPIGSWRSLLFLKGPIGSCWFLKGPIGSWRVLLVPEGSCWFLKGPIGSCWFLKGCFVCKEPFKNHVMIQ